MRFEDCADAREKGIGLLVVWIDAQQLVCDADGRMEPLPYDMRFQADTQPQAGVIEAGASASDEAGASRGRGQDPSARSN